MGGEWRCSWPFGALSQSAAPFNPAVTLGLAIAGKFAWQSVPGFIAAQLLGGLVGAALVYLFYRDHYAASSDSDAKLATFATAPAIRNLPNNLVSEIIGTFVLMFAVLMAVEPSITRDDTLNPTASGLKIGLGTLGALPRRAAGAVDRPVTRRHDRIRDQSSARFGAANRPRGVADSR